MNVTEQDFNLYKKTVDTNIKSISARLAVLETNLLQLTNNLAALEASITTLPSSYAARLNSITTDITTINNEIVDIYAKLDTLL